MSSTSSSSTSSSRSSRTALMTMTTTTVLILSINLFALAPSASGFKSHPFCNATPQYLRTRFPIYRLDVDTKTDGIPWAYRQNNTLTVSIKALYEKYKIKQIFLSAPGMTKGTPEVPSRRIFRGEWKWDMKGGMIPVDCTSRTGGGFGGGAQAVRDLWWYKGGFYNVTAEWNPINTIYNAFNVDMVEFEVYVSPDAEEESNSYTFQQRPPSRWVRLTTDKFVNLDYIDLHRFLRIHPHAQYVLSTLGGS